MDKKNIAWMALLLFMAMVSAVPLAGAVFAPVAVTAHQHGASHEGCPMPSPVKQSPANGHGGFTSCCGTSFIGFGTDSNMLGIFFASTLLIISYALFIPSRITAELFRPPKH